MNFFLFTGISLTNNANDLFKEFIYEVASMIKGVNKKVIEINDTENIYFEKAVLYVRPKMLNVPEKHLIKEAGFFLDENSPESTKEEETFFKIKRFALSCAVTCIILSIITVGFFLIK